MTTYIYISSSFEYNAIIHPTMFQYSQHNPNNFPTKQDLQLRSKKTYFKIQCRPCIEKLTMSGLIFRLGPLLEYLIFYDPYEHVALSDHQEAYNKLKGAKYLWFGQYIPRGIVKLPDGIGLVKDLQQLEEIILKKTIYQKIIVSYKKQNTSDDDFIGLTDLGTSKHIILYNIDESQNQDVFANIINQKQSEKENKKLGVQQQPMFPNFCLLSSNNKTEVNKVRSNLYWMLSWQNFKSAQQHFLRFMEYYCQEENIAANTIFLKNLSQKYKQVFRNKQRDIKLYTMQSCFFKVINAALRVFRSPLDFAHIRYPFRMIFFSIIELFLEQKDEPFRKKEFNCYRGTLLTNQQFKLLTHSIGKYIQMNGFLSATMDKAVGKQFYKNCMITITVPPVKGSNNFFVSFADISNYSNYDQKEILFNPLNVFRVQSTKETKPGHYQIHLRYINIDTIPRNDQNISQIDSNLVQNYHYQRNMLSLNRNQGEYQWKQWDSNASQFYKDKTVILLKEVELNNNKVLPINNNKQGKQHIFEDRIENFFYKRIQDFVDQFAWKSQVVANRKLIFDFITDFQYKATQLHYHIGKTLEIQLNFQNAFLFLTISYNTTSRLFARSSSFNYTILTNVGISLAYLQQYSTATKIFQVARHNFLGNLRIYQSNYPFIIFAAATFHQKGDMQSYLKFRQLMSGIIKNTENKKKVQHHSWLEILDNIQDIGAVRKFQRYYQMTYGKTNQYLKKVYVWRIQAVLLEGMEFGLGLGVSEVGVDRKAQLQQDLQVCLEILKDYQFYKQMEMIYIGSLQTACMNQIKSLTHYPNPPKPPKPLHLPLPSTLPHYQLTLYILTLQHTLNPSRDSHSQLLQLHTLLLKKYRYEMYLHFHFLVLTIHFCIALGRKRSAQIAVELMRVLKSVITKIRVLVTADLRHVRVLVEAIRKMGKGN